MKRSLFLTNLFCFMCFGFCAADEAPQNSAGSPALPPLIFDTMTTSIYLNTNNFLAIMLAAFGFLYIYDV